jgi:hypothetical protein
MATLNVAALSPAQREIWHAEEEYWTRAKDRDAEGVIALTHDRVAVWPHFAPTPMDSLHVREDTRVRVARATIADFELSFHAIEVHGDAAVVYYIIAVINSTTSSNAAPDKTRACITHTWIRDRGAWRLAGGMSRPGE